MIEFFERLKNNETHRVVGLMSGTSADGVDAVLCEIRGGGGADLELRVLGDYQHPFEPALRDRILAACTRNGGSSAELCALNMLLGEAFANAALGAIHTAQMSPADVDLIGSHGQTVAHYPPQAARGRSKLSSSKWPSLASKRPLRAEVENLSAKSAPPAAIQEPQACGSTLQIGSAAVIAERTGITTVSNFRARDMAVGGQGAPLVPLADYLLFRSPICHRAALNIGGIANVTWLPAGASLNDVLAFDTGPGNMILDALAVQISGGAKRCDFDGELAAEGRVNPGLLDELLTHSYLLRPPPKSTGREEFGVEFAKQLFARGTALGLNANDVIATASAFTARSIADALTRLSTGLPGETPLEVVVAGGGAHNPILMALLRHYLREWSISTSVDFGIGVTQRECAAFAILARETVLGRPGNVCSATGASGARVLGDITPGCAT